MTARDATAAPRRLEEFLQRDHTELDELLRVAVSGATVDLSSYERFRGGLLRHIGIEEKILVPFARQAGSEEALAIARQLKLDHAALVALLVPTPTPAIAGTIQALLAEHNPLEEGEAGFYAICGRVAGGDAEELLRRAQAAPEVPLAAHFDGARAFANIDRLLRAAGRRSD